MDKAAVQADWVDAVRRQQALFVPYTMYVPGGGCGFHATYDLMGLSLFSAAIYDARDEIEMSNKCQIKSKAQMSMGTVPVLGYSLM